MEVKTVSQVQTTPQKPEVPSKYFEFAAEKELAKIDKPCIKKLPVDFSKLKDWLDDIAQHYNLGDLERRGYRAWVEICDHGVNGVSRTLQFGSGSPRTANYIDIPVGLNALREMVTDFINKDPRAKHQGVHIVDGSNVPYRIKTDRGTESGTFIGFPKLDVWCHTEHMNFRVYESGRGVRELQGDLIHNEFHEGILKATNEIEQKQLRDARTMSRRDFIDKYNKHPGPLLNKFGYSRYGF